MTSLEAARQLLPAWLPLVAGLPLLAVGFGIGLLTTGLASWVARAGIRAEPDQHWTVTASAQYPARQVATTSTLLCVAFAVTSLTTLLGPLCPIPSTPMGILIGLATLWGCALPAARVAPAPAFRKGTLDHLRGLLIRLLFLSTGGVVVVAMLVLLEPRFDARNVAIASVGFLAYTGSIVWGALPLARVLGLLRPPSERLRAAVERASQRTKVVPRAVFEIDLPMANAFALVVPRWIVFTTACSALGEREIEAIACHELGHLSEPRAVVCARVLAGYRLFPVGFLAVLYSSVGVEQTLVSFVALFLAVHLAQRALARRMEVRADRVAHVHEDDAGVYALALEHLYQLNLAPAVLAGRGATHPALYDRMKAAGVEPSWPRPRPPSRGRLLAGSGVAILVGPLALFSVGWLGLGYSGGHPLWSIAIRGGSASDFRALGYQREQQDDTEGAITFYRAAVDLSPERSFYRAQLAEQLAIGERCDESRAELEQAIALAGSKSKESWWIEDASEVVAARCDPDSDASDASEP